MKEISIVGATFYGNRGAEAMLSTTIGQLQDQHNGSLGFNVFTYYPKRDRQLVPDESIAIHPSTPAYLVLVLVPCALLFRLLSLPGLRALRRLLPGSVQSLARSDALICLAGVSFVEGRTKFLPFNIATILPAMLLGVPVIKFAQAMGPFESFLNRCASRIFLGRCHQIFTRGERTHAHVQTLLGSRKNYERADDVAFLFKPEFCLSKPADGLQDSLEALLVQRHTGRRIIGVCPSIVVAKRAESAGWDYTQRVVNLVSALVERGHSVALYPNATRGDDMDKTHNNDLPLLEKISRDLPPSVSGHVVGFSGSLNAAQIHRIICACDVHAVSRFHAMIAALSSRVPVLVIGWSHKYLEVMERFGQDDMVIDYKRGELDPVLACMDRLLDEREERARSIGDALPEVRDLARRQIGHVVGLIETTP